MATKDRNQKRAVEVANTVAYCIGSSLLHRLHDRFPLESLSVMLDECVAATGETGIDEQLKELWLTHSVHDLTGEQSVAIARTARQEVQSRIELIVRGFLSAPVQRPEKASLARAPKKKQQCPCCWGTDKGVGKRVWQRQVNGPVVKRCYRCDSCDHRWVIEERTDEEDGVEYKTTRLVEVRNDG